MGIVQNRGIDKELVAASKATAARSPWIAVVDVEFHGGYDAALAAGCGIVPVRVLARKVSLSGQVESYATVIRRVRLSISNIRGNIATNRAAVVELESKLQDSRVMIGKLQAELQALSNVKYAKLRDIPYERSIVVSAIRNQSAKIPYNERKIASHKCKISALELELHKFTSQLQPLQDKKTALSRKLAIATIGNDERVRGKLSATPSQRVARESAVNDIIAGMSADMASDLNGAYNGY